MANEVEVLLKARDPAGTPFDLTYAHGAVHRDVIINASHVQAAGTTEVLYFMKTPDDLNKQVHLAYAVTGGSDIEVRFYRAPAVATNGTLITTTRLHDSSAKTTGALVYTGGTVTGGNYGTLLKEQWNGGGGAGAGVRGGNAVHEDAEFLLRNDTWYCLRVTRTGSQKIGTEFEWYEVPS